MIHTRNLVDAAIISGTDRMEALSAKLRATEDAARCHEQHPLGCDDQVASSGLHLSWYEHRKLAI